jgi:hypothetical protein
MSKSKSPARAGKESQPIGMLNHHPELAHWLPAMSAEGERKNVFPIYADNRAKSKTEMRGPLIATISVNPAFTEDAAQRIAWLMSRAPDVWRTLRDTVKHLQDNLEQVDDFATAVESLWDASGHFPFEYVHEDEGEEEMIVNADAQALAKLNGKAVAHV